MEERLSDHQSNENPTTISINDQETRITIREEDDHQNSDQFKRAAENGNIDHEKSTEESFDQRVCRICHLSSPLEEKGKEMVDFLIELGCACKGELGFAHTLCAEAWFKLRGNRSCEICGLPANNITGVSDNRFMEVWNENRLVGTNANVSETRRCWQGQPLCNFLMGCLVLAFVLPWFFHVNMF